MTIEEQVKYWQGQYDDAKKQTEKVRRMFMRVIDQMQDEGEVKNKRIVDLNRRLKVLRVEVIEAYERASVKDDTP